MDKGIALLTSVGSGICGAAAVLGAEATLKSKPYKTAVAVSTVVIFGTVSMFLYPALYNHGILDLTPEQMGIYTGSTLHEVAHVAGAGNSMGKEISEHSYHCQNDTCYHVGSGFVNYKLHSIKNYRQNQKTSRR